MDSFVLSKFFLEIIHKRATEISAKAAVIDPDIIWPFPNVK